MMFDDERSQRIERARTKRYAELTAWLTGHPRAWDGWPTTMSPISTDPDIHHARTLRLVVAGCPLKLARETVDVNSVIASIRIERRRVYARAVSKGAV